MKISAKFFLLGAFFGFGLLIGIFQFLPDGKLHIIFCSVGQGDAIYIRFPNQHDMIIDGGPNNEILSCLGSHMPFYDRTIDVVMMTHPQKDHFYGLIGVFNHYRVKDLITVPVANKTISYKQLVGLIKSKNIPVRYVTSGDSINVGQVRLSIIWPEKNWLSQNLKLDSQDILLTSKNNFTILGYTTKDDLNLYSIYTHLSFGNFDALFTGDGDQQTQRLIQEYGFVSQLPRNIEVFKVPHHGSKKGISDEFLEIVKPQVSIIQVGKNSYGHPVKQVIDRLSKTGQVLRTDTDGTIEIISNGQEMKINK